MEQYFFVKDLPEDWDLNIQNNIYLKRSFLELIEATDDSEKTYYVFRNSQGFIDTQFIIHKRDHYNLTMFSALKTSIKMSFVYFPVSVSRPAIIWGNETKEEVRSFLISVKGYKMILNTTKDTILENFAKGMTCPRCVLRIRWGTFAQYMTELRSSYRHRYNKAFKKSKELQMIYLKNNKKEFTEEMYALYLEVYENSPYKLEKLTIDFFRQDCFTIFVLQNGNNGVEGFVQLLKNQKELIFEFVGFDHRNNNKYDIYIRLLLEIVKYGIENGFETIDFGQTADDTKLKLGCDYEMLYALLNHSNPIINYICTKLAPFIQYAPLDESKFHVFKTAGEEGSSK